MILMTFKSIISATGSLFGQ